MAKVALITGITGQDGHYLSRLLLSKGYTVHGWTRDRNSTNSVRLLQDISTNCAHSENFDLHQIDPLSEEMVCNFIAKIRPEEIYNLGSQSHVGTSFEEPGSTFVANTHSVLLLLEAIRRLNSQSKIRLFQASSAAVYEGSTASPQDEATTFTPRSPYAASKASAQLLVAAYRKSYDLFACSGILYNHESSLRPSTFVTGKIVEAVAKIAIGQDEKLTLGNLETGRDWGYAGDYVEAMWQILQHDQPEDFVIATGKWNSLKEFLTTAFQTVGLDWQDYTHSDPALFRPTEPVRLVGDISKIKKELGWVPSISFDEMIEQMVKEKILLLREELKSRS